MTLKKQNLENHDDGPLLMALTDPTANIDKEWSLIISLYQLIYFILRDGQKSCSALNKNPGATPLGDVAPSSPPEEGCVVSGETIDAKGMVS